MTRAALGLIAAALLGAGCATSGGGATETVEEPLEELVRRQVPTDFSGVVLVSERGALPVVVARGWADAERRIPNRPGTLFDVASITKTFTGIAAMRLVETGRLEVDTTVGELLPAAPADKRPITVGQLLTHTSGLREYVASPPNDFEPLTRAQAVERILSQELRFRPGTREAYSNAGTTLLAAMLEVASGETYEALVQRTVFEPAGVDGAGFYGLARPRDLVATAYGDVAHGANNPREWRTSWALTGAGGAVMSAADLVAVRRAYWGGELLEPGSVATLERPTSGEDAAPQVAAHAGASSYGFNAALVEFPGADTYLAVLSNRSGRGSWAAEALAGALGPLLAERLGIAVPSDA